MYLYNYVGTFNDLALISELQNEIFYLLIMFAYSFLLLDLLWPVAWENSNKVGIVSDI